MGDYSYMVGDDAEESSDEEDCRAELARQIRMGAIPDTITIHAARKQCNMSHQLGDDYWMIPSVTRPTTHDLYEMMRMTRVSLMKKEIKILASQR